MLRVDSTSGQLKIYTWKAKQKMKKNFLEIGEGKYLQNWMSRTQNYKAKKLMNLIRKNTEDKINLDDGEHICNI